ncbi:hypothetical protein [Paenibacillus thalictri]|nr:hypothetical protein [Paenibacillus thalictri]
MKDCSSKKIIPQQKCDWIQQEIESVMNEIAVALEEARQEALEHNVRFTA